MTAFLIVRLPSRVKSLEAVEYMEENCFSYRISSNFHLSNLLMSSEGVEDSLAQIMGLSEEFKPEKEEIQIVKGLMKAQINEDHQERGDSIVPSGNREKEQEKSILEPVEVKEEVDSNGIEGVFEANDSANGEEENYDEEKEQKFLNEEVLNPKKTETRHLFNCPVELCPLSFMKLDHLDEHLKKSHSDEENLSCDVCMKTFSSLDDAVSHSWMKETRKCCGCGRTLSTKGKLLAHIGSHTKPFSCGYCEKRLATKAELERHERTHTGEKPFQCTHYGKRFSDRSTLTYHIRIHTGKNPYECSHCGRRFSDRSTMTRHIRIHTGEKPFECSHCGKRFHDRNNLKRHIRIHTGQKPFSCKECDKKFNQSGSLKSHMKSMHQEPELC